MVCESIDLICPFLLVERWSNFLAFWTMLMDSLQILQNVVAHVILKLYCRTSVKSVLLKLPIIHWLPIQQRCTFKVLYLALKNHLLNQPHLLSQEDLCAFTCDTLCSVWARLLRVPKFRRCHKRRCYFFHHTTKMWTSLTVSLRLTSDKPSFRKSLKMWLFQQL